MHFANTAYRYAERWISGWSLKRIAISTQSIELLLFIFFRWLDADCRCLPCGNLERPFVDFMNGKGRSSIDGSREKGKMLSQVPERTLRPMKQGSKKYSCKLFVITPRGLGLLQKKHRSQSGEILLHSWKKILFPQTPGARPVGSPCLPLPQLKIALKRISSRPNS